MPRARRTLMRSPSRAPRRRSLGVARRSSTTATSVIATVCTAAKVTSTGCGPNASSTGPTPKTPSGCARPKIITFTVITLGRSCGGTRSVMQRVDRRVDEPVREPREAERPGSEPGARLDRQQPQRQRLTEDARSHERQAADALEQELVGDGVAGDRADAERGEEPAGDPRVGVEAGDDEHRAR